MSTTHPAIRHKDTGLVFVRGYWGVEYSTDGRRKRKSLGTPDLTVARARRDAFYAELDAAGATTNPSIRGTALKKALTNPDSSQYIYYRRPWIVKVLGVYVGEFETQEEARVARNAALKESGVAIDEPTHSPQNGGR